MIQVWAPSLSFQTSARCFSALLVLGAMRWCQQCTYCFSSLALPTWGSGTGDIALTVVAYHQCNSLNRWSGDTAECQSNWTVFREQCFSLFLWEFAWFLCGKPSKPAQWLWDRSPEYVTVLLQWLAIIRTWFCWKEQRGTCTESSQ